MNMPESVKDQIAQLPRTPGVYFFKDSTGEIMYVGKATSLRDRVRSYWSKELNRGPYIIKMVGLVHKIDHETCESSLEALILEANYIKNYLPKYNIQFKDDKSFYFVKIDSTQHDGFSKVTIVHKNEIAFDSKEVRYFGPYSSGKYLRKALNMIRRIFTYRSCNIMPKRPCLQYYINNCPAPCAGHISVSDYQKNLNHIIDLLEGKKERVVATLKKEMEALSKKKKYEEATIVRDKYLALQHLKHSAKLADFDLEIKAEKEDVPHRIEGYDVSNLSGKEAVVSMVTFIDGKPKKSLYKKFKIRTVTGSDDYAMLVEAIGRRFTHLEDVDGWGLPNLVIVDGGKGQVNAIKSLLMSKEIEIEVIGIAKGPTRKKEDLYLNPESKFKDVSIIRAVRDEAHRFAIAYHKKLRAKKSSESMLDTIAGIGKVKKMLLLQKFGSTEAVLKASESDLQKIVGKRVAGAIKELNVPN